MKRGKGLIAVLLVSGVSALGLGAAASEASVGGKDATTTIVIWVDNVQKPAVDRITSRWGSARGVNVDVRTHDFGTIRDDLKKVQPENAPDAIVAAHDWTGDLAANGLVLRLAPRKTVRAQFPGYALSAFSYRGVLYGAPFALENAAMVVNTRLARVPRNFADFQRQALRFKARGGGRIALAVPQGAGGDAYHMYPFFSGLCGYVFGKTKNGALNPRNVGLDNPRFLRNAPMIDRWNRLGLINSRVDYGNAKDSFLKGRAAFWITGPWETQSLKDSGLRFRIVPFPQGLPCRSVPFLGVQGLMVTRFANTHGVANLTKSLVTTMMGPSDQFALAAANQRFPANRTAARRVRDATVKQFGSASAGGVPMPNIPEMGSVWSELGGAWVKATRGAGATRAVNAFRTAARNIRAKIAAG
jgi:arabinogalactan oligomer/maltooligosaccharide transport system substrate-binding protein